MYREVSDKIHELIEKQQLWDQYLAPERELARMFGVSRETVRRGLELLERQGILTRRHGQGTLVLSKSRKRDAGSKGRVVVGSYQGAGGGGYVGDMMAGLTSAAAQTGWLLSFSNLMMPAARQEFFEEVNSGQVDGMLLLSFTDRPLVEEVLRVWHGPLVLVDHYFEDLPVTSVIDDSEGGARQVVEHFIELGHRRIGYAEITRREMNPWRYRGYASALGAAGIELDESLIRPTFGSFEGGRGTGDELLSLADPPTAIFAFDDNRAWGVWRAAEARGLEVGKDLALAGFGDQAAKAGFAEDLLTSVGFDGRQLGRAAVNKLDEQIAGKSPRGELVKVPTELTIRQSSRNAHQATAR
jgi:DNA-binding LacI/PurR family transcriptional regulator